MVAILGPRQVGKTTLARELVASRKGGATLFDLQRAEDLALLLDPILALEPARGLVVIDEVQRRPKLFPSLRVLVDQHRVRRRCLVWALHAPSRLIRKSVLHGRDSRSTAPSPAWALEPKSVSSGARTPGRNSIYWSFGARAAWDLSSSEVLHPVQPSRRTRPLRIWGWRKVEIELCPRCAGAMNVLRFITEQAVLRRIPAHLERGQVDARDRADQASPTRGDARTAETGHSEGLGGHIDADSRR